MIVVLDNIRSAHNVGSIFRTSDAVGGIGKIILCGVTPGPRDRFGMEHARVTKVSLGAERTVAWEHAATTRAAVEQLKVAGYAVVALERTAAARSVFEAAAVLRSVPDAKRALVLGSETDGVAADILALADYTLAIPMRGEKESLNVGVAFGIAAYALSTPTV